MSVVKRIKKQNPFASLGLPHIILKPGELHVAWQPTIVSTILGSCVAVVLFLPKSQVSAVCHGMLPFQGDNNDEPPFQFMDSSILYMLKKLRVGPENRPIVKIFGGADMVNAGRDSGGAKVGEMNIQAAKQVLSQKGYRVDIQKIGGIIGCKIYVRSDTGQVMHRYL